MLFTLLCWFCFRPSELRVCPTHTVTLSPSTLNMTQPHYSFGLYHGAYSDTCATASVNQLSKAFSTVTQADLLCSTSPAHTNYLSLLCSTRNTPCGGKGGWGGGQLSCLNVLCFYVTKCEQDETIAKVKKKVPQCFDIYCTIITKKGNDLTRTKSKLN